MPRPPNVMLGEIVIKAVQEGKSFREIGKAINRAPSTVYDIWKRARKRASR